MRLRDHLFRIANNALQAQGVALSYRSAGEFHFQATDQKGRRYILPTWSFQSGHLGMRSVLRVRKGSVPRWLCNGQPSRGTRGLAFWGEQGPQVRLSKDEYRQALRDEYPLDKFPNFSDAWIEQLVSRSYLPDAAQYRMSTYAPWEAIPV